MQGHPGQCWDRCRDSGILLDSLIRLLNLTHLDAERPEAQYSLFATHASTVDASSGRPPTFTDAVHGAASAQSQSQPGAQWNGIDFGVGGADRSGSGRQVKCACRQYTLKQQWPTVSEIAPLWETTAMWPDGMSEGELRKEECRRLMWSSVMLTAGQNSYTSADAEKERADLFIKDYRNVG